LLRQHFRQNGQRFYFAEPLYVQLVIPDKNRQQLPPHFAVRNFGAVGVLQQLVEISFVGLYGQYGRSRSRCLCVGRKGDLFHNFGTCARAKTQVVRKLQQKEQVEILVPGFHLVEGDDGLVQERKQRRVFLLLLYRTRYNFRKKKQD